VKSEVLFPFLLATGAGDSSNNLASSVTLFRVSTHTCS
jgi:hypothetical protein